MRKIINKILVIMILLFPAIVLADDSINVSLSSITLQEEETTSVTITINDTEGEVKVVSSDTSVATIEESKWEDKEIDKAKYKVGTLTVKGVKAGETTIKITVDNSKTTKKDSEDDKKNNTEEKDKITDKMESIIKVTVKEKPKEPEKSTNNKVKELVIENYNVEKVDDNNYTLTVINNVEKINIKVTPEDEKAKVRGDGEKTIEIGDNNFEIVVTSESEEENIINVKVTRKSKYTIEDVEELLKDDKLNSIVIDIDKNTKVSSMILSKIRESKKTVNLNYYDGNDKLIYSIILDGNLLEDIDEFTTDISNDSQYSKEISKLSDNKKGMEISLLNRFPKGSKIKLYFGDTYKSGEIVEIYYYDRLNNNLELYKEDIMVSNGYIELEPTNYNNYFITKLLKEEDDSVVVTTGTVKKGLDLSKVFMIILVAVVISLIIVASVLYCKKYNINLFAKFRKR